MRVNIEFDIDARDVSVVESDGSLTPVFATERLTENLAATSERKLAGQLRSSIVTVMSEPGYDLWELADGNSQQSPA